MIEIGLAVFMMSLLGVALGGARLRYLFFVRITGEELLFELGFFFTRTLLRKKRTIAQLGPKKKP